MNQNQKNSLEEITKSADAYRMLHKHAIHLFSYMGISPETGQRIWEKEKDIFRAEYGKKSAIVGSFFDSRTRESYIQWMRLEALHVHNQIFYHVKPYMIDKLERDKDDTQMQFVWD